MSALIALAAGLMSDVRETLPDSEQTAGVWLAGFVWAFVIHWTVLILVTWLHVIAGGQP